MGFLDPVPFPVPDDRFVEWFSEMPDFAARTLVRSLRETVVVRIDVPYRQFRRALGDAARSKWWDTERGVRAKQHFDLLVEMFGSGEVPLLDGDGGVPKAPVYRDLWVSMVEQSRWGRVVQCGETLARLLDPLGRMARKIVVLDRYLFSVHQRGGLRAFIRFAGERGVRELSLNGAMGGNGNDLASVRKTVALARDWARQAGIHLGCDVRQRRDGQPLFHDRYFGFVHATGRSCRVVTIGRGVRAFARPDNEEEHFTVVALVEPESMTREMDLFEDMTPVLLST